MGFRFRKSIKLLPGIKLNISKKGIGTSIGMKGFHVSSGPSGSRMTTSVPGTGVSHSTNLGSKKGQKTRTASKANFTQLEVLSGTKRVVTAKNPFSVKPWRAILGIFSLLTTLSVFVSGLKISDALIAFLIFMGLTILLLFPWIRWLYGKIKGIYTKNDNLPETQNLQSHMPPPDPPATE